MEEKRMKASKDRRRDVCVCVCLREREAETVEKIFINKIVIIFSVYTFFTKHFPAV